MSIEGLEEIRQMLFRECRLDPNNMGCRKFDYSSLKVKNSEYQERLSSKILEDYDEFYSRVGRDDTVSKIQNRFLVREVHRYDEILVLA